MIITQQILFHLIQRFHLGLAGFYILLLNNKKLLLFFHNLTILIQLFLFLIQCFDLLVFISVQLAYDFRSSQQIRKAGGAHQKINIIITAGIGLHFQKTRTHLLVALLDAILFFLNLFLQVTDRALCLVNTSLYTADFFFIARDFLIVIRNQLADLFHIALNTGNLTLDITDFLIQIIGFALQIILVSAALLLCFRILDDCTFGIHLTFSSFETLCFQKACITNQQCTADKQSCIFLFHLRIPPYLNYRYNMILPVCI